MSFSLLYTALRYIVFGNTEYHQWPLFLGNKAISLGGIILLALSYLLSQRNNLTEPEKKQHLSLIRFCGLGGFSLIGMHAFASLMVLTPINFPKFYHDSGQMNFIGEFSMLMGVVSLWCFCLPAITTIPNMFQAIGEERWRRNQRVGYFGLALAAIHVGVMGLPGWMTPEKWYGYLPPITLVSFVVAAIPLILRLRKNGRNGAPKE